MKKFFILLFVLFAVAVFTALAIFIAPYIICPIGQVLYDKWHIIRYESEIAVVYNFLLGFITFVMGVITFVLFRHKRLRVYTLLFIPHILSLIIAIFYIGLKIRYLGDGFIQIKTSSRYEYRNSKGKVIISSYEYLCKKYHNGAIVFVDEYGISPTAWYSEDGVCFLRKPVDDDWSSGIYTYSDFFYTKKMFCDDDGHFDYERVRFFDEDGNYVITREYGTGGYDPKRAKKENGILLAEYREEVDELPDGVKIFKAK